MRNDAETTIGLGDPVPWFSARTIGGSSVELQVNAGRWVVLCFAGSLSRPQAEAELQHLLSHAAQFDEDRLIAFVVVSEPPADVAFLNSVSSPGLSFLADYDGSLTRRFFAADTPRTIVLDPLLRAVANIAFDHPAGHGEVLTQVLSSLPDPDGAAGIPLTAPALIVPRVFEFPFCEFLVRFFEQHGGNASGFLMDRNGLTETVVDRRYKSRRDLAIVEPTLREAIRQRIVRRLVPEIEKFFQFRATRMDRTMVSCYDSDENGHFSRHRDNVNAGARHRRFAASINLNGNYEGCDLIFPEFGRRRYKAPVGGAIVFSCGALHQVTPVTRGRRYAFVPFFYGEEDARLRLRNNVYLRAGELPYTGDRDRLFPAAEETSLVPDLSPDAADFAEAAA